MIHETIQGTFRQTNLTNESAEYLAKREELRLAEIELMHQRERVAELRRHLPPGPALEDYKFIEGPVDLDSGDTPTRTVRLSELFTAAGRPLVIYHLMYGKRQTKPCPMCTAWIDGINGVAHHIAQNVDFAIAPPKRPRFVWHLRFLRPRRTAIRNPAPEGSGPLRPLGTSDALPSPFVAFAGDRSPGFVRWRTTTARNGGGRYIAPRVPVHATRFPERGPRPVHAWMSSRPDIGGADSDTATRFGQ